MPHTGGRVARRGKPGRPPNINENSLMRRLQCVLSVQSGEMDMDQACDMYDISTRTYYRWLRSKSRLIELTGYNEEAQDQNRHQRPRLGRGRSPRKNVSDIPGNAKRMPRRNQRHRPVDVTQLRSVRPISGSLNNVAGSSTVAKTTTPVPRSGNRPVGAGTSSRLFASSHYRMPTLHHGPHVSNEPMADGRSNDARAQMGPSRSHPIFSLTQNGAPKMHQRANISHRVSPAQGGGTANAEQGNEGASGTSTLRFRKRSLTEPQRNDRNSKRGRDTLVSHDLTVFDEGEDTADEALLQAGRLEGNLQNENIPHSTSGMDRRNSQETPSSSIDRTDNHRLRPSQTQGRPTGGLRRGVSRENSARLASQNNASGPRAHPHPTWVSVAPVAYIDSAKRRLEIMSGRRKVVIAFYRGALAADIKDAISRRFALLSGAQWALTDQHGDEIVVSEGIPSGRYTLNVLG